MGIISQSKQGDARIGIAVQASEDVMRLLWRVTEVSESSDGGVTLIVVDGTHLDIHDPDDDHEG